MLGVVDGLKKVIASILTVFIVIVIISLVLILGHSAPISDTVHFI